MTYLNSAYLMPVWQLLLLGVVIVALCGGLAFALRKLFAGKNSGSAFEQRLRDSEKRYQDLRRSEEKFRHLYEAAPVGILCLMVDGSRALMGNEAAARMFGYESVDEFLAECRPKDIYADPDQYLELVDALNREGRVEGYEITIRRPDGKQKILSLWAHIHVDEGCMEGAVVDVTAERLAQRELRDGHLFLQAVMDTLPNPVFYKDRAGRIRHVSRAFEEFMGQGKSSVLGKPATELVPEQAREQWEEADQRLMAASGAAMQRFDSWVRTRGGGQRDVVVQEGLVSDSKGNNIGIVGVLTDVTEFKRVERNLRDAEATYRNIFLNSAQGIFSTTPEGRFVQANPALARQLGYDSSKDLIERVTDIAQQIYANPNQRDLLLAAIERDGEVHGQEIQVVTREGERLWMSLSMRPVLDADGNTVRLEGVASDITDRKASENELTRLATTDGLTNLPNRFLFEKSLERMLAQAKRSGQRLAVLFMDLDKFKAVNDTHGHQVGDELLVQVADRIRARLRESDMAARLGGDEFGILLWNPADREVVRAMAEDIVRDVGQPLELSVGEVHVGVSIGGSFYPEHGDDARTLVKAADDAMYAVKEAGRNGFRFAD